MDPTRAAIDSSEEQEARSQSAEHDTLPPSASRRCPETDDTAGLVSVLYHAQQAALGAGTWIDAARDTHDEELASFLEGAQRENFARANKAKQLLGARLGAENKDAYEFRHDTPHGRVHYVSIPDGNRDSNPGSTSGGNA